MGIHVTCTTDTTHTLTHPTLMYIFTSTLGIKCSLPVSYAQQHQLSQTFPFTLSTVSTMLGAPSTYSYTQIHSVLFVAGFWTSLWIFLDIVLNLIVMDPRPPSSTASSTCASSLVLDSAARRSCTKCSRRMSSYAHDRHTLCLYCRNVLCFVENRCMECSSWSTDEMLDYLKHRKS